MAATRFLQSCSKRPSEILVLAAAMLLAAVLALNGLANQMFWDDEANTAIYGRNLLELGKMTAWDGTNLVAYSHGGALGEDLGQELRVPPLPAYVAAAGMLLFGETTFGGRILFALAGVVSVGLLAVWLRRFLGRRFPWYLSAFILALSPAFLLYIRNCRYYALGVMFTLLVWTFWTPDSTASRGRPGRGGGDRLFDRRSVLRYLAAAAAMAGLIFSHYLNAATVLATLPLFFLDRRFRRKKQIVLLGILYGAAALCALWICLTVYPFAADYSIDPAAMVLGNEEVGPWRHFSMNLFWLVRDLGTHEFFPWCLVPVLILPWLPLRSIPWFAARAGRLRPLAWRGGILIGILLAYLVLVAALTPADMGKGPTAEMRYVVPLIALGAAVAGVALVILQRLFRPAALAAFLLLVGTNWLHLGFLAERSDNMRTVWPPTLSRYVTETFHDYQTGNEAIVGLLRQLPEETTVRVWPGHMVYPSMFYAPHLHYCNQLVESKRIEARLKPLPDYLYVDRIAPDVVLTPSGQVHDMLATLSMRHRDVSYRICNSLPPRASYTSKPEIPTHLFSAPSDRARFLGMAVLVQEQSPVASHKALSTDPTDPDALCRLATTFKTAGQFDSARRSLQEALRVDPDHVESHFQLGTLLMSLDKPGEAASHFQTAVRLNPRHASAHLNLGVLFFRLGRTADARRHYLIALEIESNLPAAHFNLGNIALQGSGAIDRAVFHYEAALRLKPEYAKAHAKLGFALLRRGDVAESIDHFQSALRIEPSMAEAHLGLAGALRANRNHRAAIREYQAALELVAPESRQAADIRVWIEELEPTD